LHLGFFSGGKLKRIDLSTGLVTSIADTPQVVSGGSWSQDGTIIYAARYAILAVPSTGGTPTTVATLNSAFQENSLRYPHLLPDGRHFLYVARSGRPQQSAVYLGALDGKSTRLFPTMTEVGYASPGFLIYGRENALVARTIDAYTLEVGSDVVPLTPYRGADPTGMDGYFAVSGGVLAYFNERTSPSSELWWVDRSGRALQQQVTNVPGEIINFRIAPDGTQVVADSTGGATSTGRSVWVLHGNDVAPARITFERSDDWIPVWSHDGKQVIFMSYRNGVGDLFVRSITSGETEQPLLLSNVQKSPSDVSADGRYLAFSTRDLELAGAFEVAIGGPLEESVYSFKENESERGNNDGQRIRSRRVAAATRRVPDTLVATTRTAPAWTRQLATAEADFERRVAQEQLRR
jgi:Tol biopolymer transport system component